LTVTSGSGVGSTTFLLPRRLGEGDSLVPVFARDSAPSFPTATHDTVVEPTPEPEVTVKEGSDQNVPLLISANSDALVYELETDSIKLKNTMMFQTRAFSFPFKNTSTVPLEFSWAFEKDGEDPWEVAAQDGSEPVPLPDPFVIEPATGTVAPGQSINVQVHFSPPVKSPSLWFKLHPSQWIQKPRAKRQPLPPLSLPPR